MRRWLLTGLLLAIFLVVAQTLPTFQSGTQSPTQWAEPTQSVTPFGSTSSQDTSFEETISLSPDPIMIEKAAPTQVGPLVMTQALDKALLNAGQINERYLVIEIQAPESTDSERQPVHISLLLDTSGSMSSEGKLSHAQMAASELLNQLEEGDTFSLVTFSDTATVVIPTTPLSGVAMAQRALRGISPEGGTNLYDGIQVGLHQLEAIESPGNRRLILLSDGMANIGQTEPEALSRVASSLVSEGVSVSGIGLGLDYSEDTLTQISDAGGGSYHFVNRPGQLSEVFGAEFHQMTEIVAQQTSLQIDPPNTTEFVEIFGYPTTRIDNAYHLFLGDVHAGEIRKVVARIQVQGSDLAETSVVRTHLQYATPGSTTVPPETFREVHPLLASISTQQSEVEQSIIQQATISGVQAHAGWYLDQGARAWEQGDRKTNRAMLSKGRSLLQKAAEVHQAPTLAQEAAQIDAYAHGFDSADFESDAGLYQVKKAKEIARAYAH